MFPGNITPITFCIVKCELHKAALRNKSRKEFKMENKTKKSSGIKTLLLIAILAIAALAMFGIYKTFMPKGQAGAKEITVTVVHGDKTEKDFTYQTDEAYLGAVLQKEELVEGTDGEYGLFITSVDGEAADDSKEQWWCITKEGEQLNTSADQTPIADGEQFELTLKEGY